MDAQKFDTNIVHHLEPELHESGDSNSEKKQPIDIIYFSDFQMNSKHLLQFVASAEDFRLSGFLKIQKS